MFFRVLKNIELNPSFQHDSDQQINHFYLDIKNMIKGEMIYDADARNHDKHFLGGKEGILTVIDMVNHDKNSNIFPFIM